MNGMSLFGILFGQVNNAKDSFSIKGMSGFCKDGLLADKKAFSEELLSVLFGTNHFCDIKSLLDLSNKETLFADDRVFSLLFGMNGMFLPNLKTEIAKVCVDGGNGDGNVNLDEAFLAEDVPVLSTFDVNIGGFKESFINDLKKESFYGEDGLFPLDTICTQPKEELSSKEKSKKDLWSLNGINSDSIDKINKSKYDLKLKKALSYLQELLYLFIKDQVKDLKGDKVSKTKLNSDVRMLQVDGKADGKTDKTKTFDVAVNSLSDLKVKLNDGGDKKLVLKDLKDTEDKEKLLNLQSVDLESKEDKTDEPFLKFSEVELKRALDSVVLLRNKKGKAVLFRPESHHGLFGEEHGGEKYHDGEGENSFKFKVYESLFKSHAYFSKAQTSQDEKLLLPPHLLKKKRSLLGIKGEVSETEPVFVSLGDQSFNSSVQKQTFNLNYYRQVVVPFTAVMKTAIVAGRAKAKLRLYPPELGRMDVRIEVSNGVVNAHITASDKVGYEFVASNINLLKESLLKSGLELGSFQLNYNGDSSSFESAYSDNSSHDRRSNKSTVVDIKENALESEDLREDDVYLALNGIEVWA